MSELVPIETVSWEQLQRYVYEVDSSWRDIYVLDASHAVQLADALAPPHLPESHGFVYPHAGCTSRENACLQHSQAVLFRFHHQCLHQNRTHAAPPGSSGHAAARYRRRRRPAQCRAGFVGGYQAARRQVAGVPGLPSGRLAGKGAVPVAVPWAWMARTAGQWSAMRGSRGVGMDTVNSIFRTSCGAC